MSNEHKLSEIRQIAVTVSDVAVALPFYRDALGLQFLFSAGPQLAFLAAGSVRIMLSTPQGAGTVGHNSILYFKVSDIAATHAAIVGRGAERSRPATGREDAGPRAVDKLPARPGRQPRRANGGEAVTLTAVLIDSVSQVIGGKKDARSRCCSRRRTRCCQQTAGHVGLP